MLAKRKVQELVEQVSPGETIDTEVEEVCLLLHLMCIQIKAYTYFIILTLGFVIQIRVLTIHSFHNDDVAFCRVSCI